MSYGGQLYQQPSAVFCANIDAIIQENELLKQQVEELSRLARERQSESDGHLGAIEYELEKFKVDASSSLNTANSELHVCREENNRLHGSIAHLQRKIDESEKAVLSKCEELHQMETYLARLPTAEEHQRLQSELNSARVQAADYRKNLDNTKALLDVCEVQLGTAKAQLRRQEERELLLETHLSKAVQRQSAKSNENLNSQPLITATFIEDLHFEVNRYRNAYEQMKKLLEAETHRAEASEHRKKMAEREFEERIAREEAMVSGLRANISANQTKLHKLKDLISKICLEKQDMLATILQTRAELKRSAAAWHSAGGQQRRLLVVQLNSVIEEVVHLAEHLDQLADGKRLDLAQLLSVQPCATVAVNGLADTDTTLEQAFSGVDDGDLISQTSRLQQAREQVQHLRQKLTDRYADHLGGKLDCFVQ